MFAALHCDINSLNSVLFHLTGQPNSQKGRSDVKDGIISVTIFPETILVGTTYINTTKVVLIPYFMVNCKYLVY